jgi:hypothetical protein
VTLSADYKDELTRSEPVRYGGNCKLRQERARIRNEKDRLQTQVETMIDQHKLSTLLQLIGFKG